MADEKEEARWYRQQITPVVIAALIKTQGLIVSDGIYDSEGASMIDVQGTINLTALCEALRCKA